MNKRDTPQMEGRLKQAADIPTDLSEKAVAEISGFPSSLVPTRRLKLA